MKRFWVSFFSGNYADEDCTKPPFKFWVSGQRARENYGLDEKLFTELQSLHDADDMEEFLDKWSKDDCSICAVIDAESEDDIWELVAKHFPDYQHRFCDEVASDFKPSDRFQ